MLSIRRETGMMVHGHLVTKLLASPVTLVEKCRLFSLFYLRESPLEDLLRRNSSSRVEIFAFVRHAPD